MWYKQAANIPTVGRVTDYDGLRSDPEVLVYLDFETTGLNPFGGDRVCEVGLVRTRQGQVEAEFSSLVNPGRPISPGAAAVNGLTDRMVAGAPRFADLLPQLLGLLAGATIVAHNAAFDLNFLAAELRRAGICYPGNPALDTLRLARQYYRFRSNSLQAVAGELGIGFHRPHRALGDAYTTKAVFERIIFDLTGAVGVGADVALRLQGGPVYPDPQPEVRLPPDLEEALQSRQPIRVQYVDGRGTPTTRLIEPLDVYARGDVVYLVAFCHLRGEERTFRLDRISGYQPA
jgi:DNA polymerase-3 subunit epsilon